MIISSCSFLGTSISARATIFIGELNGNRSGIMESIHPDAPGYNTANGSNYWNLGVWGTKPFSLSNITESSDSLTADFSYGSSSGIIILQMKNDGDLFGDNWKIWSCSVAGDDQF